MAIIRGETGVGRDAIIKRTAREPRQTNDSASAECTIYRPTESTEADIIDYFDSHIICIGRGKYSEELYNRALQATARIFNTDRDAIGTILARRDREQSLLLYRQGYLKRKPLVSR